MRRRPVLVSGAGVGFGAYCAEGLAAWGARPFLIERNLNRANAVAARTSGFAVTGDVADIASVERAVNAATLAGGGLSGLVHAIGNRPGVAADMIRGNELVQDFAGDAVSLLNLGRTAIRAMRLEGRGLLLRLDFSEPGDPASVRVIAAAQTAIWEEIGRMAADFGIRTETVVVADVGGYAEVADVVVARFDATLGEATGAAAPQIAATEGDVASDGDEQVDGLPGVEAEDDRVDDEGRVDQEFGAATSEPSSNDDAEGVNASMVRLKGEVDGG